MKASFMGMVGLGILLAIGVTGCSPGKPGLRSETMRPDQVHDFATLYKNNCSACHGDNGLNGAAIQLNNPVFLAWTGHDRMIAIVSNGVPHRLMPAFGRGGGGLLTDRQVEDIVHGMIAHWGQPGILDGANAPAFAPASKGDVAHGEVAYQAYCARCHGADGQGIAPGKTAASRAATADRPDAVVGSIVDPTYLSLISSQGLRSIVVAGLPGEGMPDWRGDVPGKPMTEQEVTDVVAWLVSHRVEFPGQPFPSQQQH